MQVMDIVLEVYGVTNEQLQYAITEYIKDPNKVEQLRMQKMQGKSAHQEDLKKYLGTKDKENFEGLTSKTEVIAVHKKLFDLSV